MPEKRQRKKTETSSFGTSGRESHDSSKFYDSKMYRDLNLEDATSDERMNACPAGFLDKIVLAILIHK